MIQLINSEGIKTLIISCVPQSFQMSAITIK
jgi:hypothetical protein